MAVLTHPEVGIRETDPGQIGQFLSARGIRFETWPVVHVADEAGEKEILALYAQRLKPYQAQYGYAAADVVSVSEETPGLPQIREKFIAEHTHDEDEVRLFLAGKGLFWFHLEPSEEIFCLTCLPGDLLSVPAGVKHWFDLGSPACVKAIRLFTDPSGWTPRYTGSGVDQRYRLLCL